MAEGEDARTDRWREVRTSMMRRCVDAPLRRLALAISFGSDRRRIRAMGYWRIDGRDAAG